MRKSIFVRILGGYTLIVALFAVALLVFSFKAVRKSYLEDQVSHLKNLAEAMTPRITPFLNGMEAGPLEPFVRDLGVNLRVRITVISADGSVLADSEEFPEKMESHQYRPEVFQALKGETTTSVRRSSTVKADMLYMGFPLREGARITGVLRLSLHMATIDRLISGLQKRIFLTAAAIMIVFLLVIAGFSRALSRPVKEFTSVAGRVAGGDFEAKVSERRVGELGDFARSFNRMTGDLATAFASLRQKKEELSSILSSIQDGLLIIDRDDRISLLNEKFRSVLPESPTPEGRYYWEILRSSKFGELVRRVKSDRTGAAEEILFHDRTFLCRAAFLASGERVVVTLHDLSEIRDVERMKKDFVLNVSHELRTPLTAIKGFVEALDERATNAHDREYLKIIGRNTDRMIGIVRDLLTLADFEKDGAFLETEELDVRLLAENVLKLFASGARDKGIGLSLESGPGPLWLKGDPFQLEQMLINLVDNAVKFTDRGSVVVALARKDPDFVIEVRDSGPGIPEEHLPHIFERFYVVDKSRSRKLGGTGLGLSIVKHIALAHHGRVGVKSRVGEGTTFTVSLPLA
jgi:two-component system, OmpR family, phosphate regulon sensor histidine kinase PhoR